MYLPNEYTSNNQAGACITMRMGIILLIYKYFSGKAKML